MSDYAQLPWGLRHEVKALVEQATERNGWPVRQTFRSLEIFPATYHRWCRTMAQGELRKRENIKLRQRLIPRVEDQTVSYSEPTIVSL